MKKDLSVVALTKWGIPLLSMMLLAACATAPRYSCPPEVALGQGWTETSNSTNVSSDLETWWENLGDPVLTRLVQNALQANLDLRQAALRIDESRASVDIANSKRLPAAGVNGSATARRQTENGSIPIAEIPAIKRDQVIHDVGFDASWELDVFGRTRHALNTAKAQMEATEEDFHAVRISIAAEIARMYFNFRGAQKELVARRAAVADIEKILEITQQRVAVGDIAPSELDGVKAQLDETIAGISPIEGRVRGFLLALGILTGGLPEKELDLQHTAPPDSGLPQIPAGERADMLRRRPDIRAAERRLAASYHEVGFAVAEQFPKLSITGAGGFQALNIGDLAKPESLLLSLAPSISWQVFDGGRVQAQIHAAEARQKIAALAYEKAVLTALGDAERALSDYRSSLESLEKEQAALQSATRAYQTMSSRLQAGDVAVSEVLNAERKVHETDERRAVVQSTATISMVAVFKSLGGGWPADEHRSKLSNDALGKLRVAMDNVSGGSTMAAE